MVRSQGFDCAFGGEARSPVAADELVGAVGVIEVRQEFWGKRYCVLTDVNGYTYKFNPPSAGSQIKLVTRTGWYIVDSSCTIVKYEDSGRK